MTKNWIIIEKLIATFLLLWGIFSIGFLIYTLYLSYEYYLPVLHRSWRDLSFPKIFIRYHASILLPLTCITGAVLLLLNKKSGWLLAVICLSFNALLFLLPGQLLWLEQPAVFTAITILLIISLLTGAILLLLKPFHQKYRPGIGSWCTVGLMLTALLIDHWLG